MTVDTVDLLRVRVDGSSEQLAVHRESLSSEEKAKADRFRKHSDYCRSVISRGVLRELLGGYLGLKPAEICFEYGPFGKPELSPLHETKICFNVSHSGNWILIGISSGSPVGVDVEEMRSIESLEGIAKSTFSAHEFEAWRQLPTEHLRAGFFRAWTCKESVIKALGLGISLPLDNVEVDIDPRNPLTIVRLSVANESMAEWQIRSIPMETGYCAALACRSSIRTIRVLDWPQIPDRLGVESGSSAS